MKYQQASGFIAIAVAAVNGLPNIKQHDQNAQSLVSREAPLSVPVFCPYKKAKVLSKWTHHMQVSDTLDCGDGTCEVSQTNEHTFGVETSAEFGGEASKLVAPVSASIGVTVTESWTNGKTKTCAGDRGESACIWVAVPYDEVKMSDRDIGVKVCSNPQTATGKFPEARGASENYYCVRGKDNCRSDGDGYWVKK